MCKYYNLKMLKVSRDTHFLMILYPWLFMMQREQMSWCTDVPEPPDVPS